MTIPTNITINRAAGATLEGTRPRVIGRNARLPVHGQTVSEPIVRLYTDAGVSGWGWSPATPEDAQRLVGQKLYKAFSPETGTRDDLLMFDFPLWDLAGQLLELPVHAMLGGEGSSPVPVYDGSIYIDELDPDTGKDDGIAPMLHAVNMGLDAGFQAFKVKVGRGYRWMEPEAGIRRDIEVIRAIRDLVGPTVQVLIDANNGYTPDEARRVMREAGDCDIYWFEEPFEESVEACVAFKEFIREGGWNTLLADGETRSSAYDAGFKQIVRAGGVDVVQLDLRYYNADPLAALHERHPGDRRIGRAPQLGLSPLRLLHPPVRPRRGNSFAMGETDHMQMPAVTAPGYDIADGKRSVPDTPGFGLRLDEDAFAKAQRAEDAWTVGTVQKQTKGDHER